ncbi:MAG: flagellar filament capping protein FliD [Gemmatimonadales bacterium]
MTTPLSSIAGVISGFKYTDLVDAIINQARVPAARMENEIANISNRKTAIESYRTLLSDLQTAAKALRDGSAFAGTSSTSTILSGRSLATVATTAAATPATYTLKVSELARAEKLSATGTLSSSTALGVTGSFTINGKAVNVAADASLATIRDAINAANSGTTPSGVSATIISVSPTDNRLILTSNATGAAGIALADTSGTVLQGLGLLDGVGAVPLTAVLVDGRDATFAINDIPMTRSSNVIADAIDGVTLTLTAEDPTAENSIAVGHFIDPARTAMQTFADAYNKLSTFVKAQSVVTNGAIPALYGDSMIRSVRNGLPAVLLATVGGAAADLATAASVGLSLSRDGTVNFDATKFDAAFKDRFNELPALFNERRSATGTGLSFISSANNTSEGNFAVNVTTAATRASYSTTGFSGSYDAGVTPDTITFRDTKNNTTVDVALTTGMTSSDIVSALTAAFAANSLSLTAELVGNDIKVSHSAYGQLAGVTVTMQGVGDGASEAWGADGSAFGTDIVGTIDGKAATGTGQTLVGDSGQTTAGLVALYQGTGTGAIGNLSLALGTGARVERLLSSFLDTATGVLDNRVTSLTTRSEGLTTRVANMDERLARRRASLLRQFVLMEQNISALQKQSTALGSLTSSQSK